MQWLYVTDPFNFLVLFNSEDWDDLHTLYFSWQFDFCYLYPKQPSCWVIGCSIWITRCHAFCTNPKLGCICQQGSSLPPLDFFFPSHSDCGTFWIELIYFFSPLLQFVALASLFLIAIINFVLGLLPHVDNFSNVGAFLSGILLGFGLLFNLQLRCLEPKIGIFDYGAKSSMTPKQKLKQKLDKPALRISSLALFALMWVLPELSI